jgi:hypothetical protein
VSTETIPELLARLEPEHFAEKGSKFCYHPDHETMPEFPCDSARVVAHARSLEAAIAEVDDALLDVTSPFVGRSPSEAMREMNRRVEKAGKATMGAARRWGSRAALGEALKE